MDFSFFKVKINPENSSDNLAGFGKRKNTEITFGPKELYLKILWVKSNSNLIVISIDALYFPRTIAQNVIRYLANTYQIAKKNIVFNATHTHSAPSTDLNVFGQINKEYLDEINIKTIQGLDFCWHNFKKGHLEFDELSLPNKLFVKRRKLGRDIRKLFLQKKILMLPNHNRETDNNIRSIKIYDNEKKLCLIVYNFSCHPVFDFALSISSDCIGTISNAIEDQLQVQSIFLQGFAGDIRPNYTATSVKITNIKDYLKLIFNKEIFIDYDDSFYNYFCNNISTCLIQNASEKNKNPQIPAINIKLKSFTANFSSITGEIQKNIEINLILIKNNLFISLPAEVNSYYYDLLKNKFPDLRIYPLGYAPGMIGYLPGAEEVDEGGYEIYSYTNYGWDSNISKKSIEYFSVKLISEIKQLISKD
ncbi:hypothetical protein ACFLZV_03750 [Candidatus Margulisiibacteriota bacterium]